MEVGSRAMAATVSQKNASITHRRKAAAHGLLRVEVQAAASDTALIKSLAEKLRGDPVRAAIVRSTLENALGEPDVKTAFDVFGADLSDEFFEGVFDQPRERDWRKVDI